MSKYKESKQLAARFHWMKRNSRERGEENGLQEAVKIAEDKYDPSFSTAHLCLS